jgi:hypothetical protein
MGERSLADIGPKGTPLPLPDGWTGPLSSWGVVRVTRGGGWCPEMMALSAGARHGGAGLHREPGAEGWE